VIQNEGTVNYYFIAAVNCVYYFETKLFDKEIYSSNCAIQQLKFIAATSEWYHPLLSYRNLFMFF
jgi:hypothetical protein